MLLSANQHLRKLGSRLLKLSIIFNSRDFQLLEYHDELQYHPNQWDILNVQTGLYLW